MTALVVLAAALAGTVAHLVFSRSDLKPSTISPASPLVLSEIARVTPAVENAVGLPGEVTVPLVARHQARFVVGGLPAALYIGADFCPYCAAERWAIIMTFDRFGTFTGLTATSSSPWDLDPRTPTFSFYKAHYSSPYVSLLAVEREGNDTDGLGTSHILQPLTSLESDLWSHYSAVFRESEGFPFVDIGNEVFVLGEEYDPGVLAGLGQRQVADDLKDPSAPSTRDIVGTANYLTAAVCALTGGHPGKVCTVTAVQQAAKRLRLSLATPGS